MIPVPGVLPGHTLIPDAISVTPESAVIYPNEDWFAAQNGGRLPDRAEMEKTVVRRAQERSAELADYKRVRKVVVWPEPLERTSIGKVRRVAYKGKLDE